MRTQLRFLARIALVSLVMLSVSGCTEILDKIPKFPSSKPKATPMPKATPKPKVTPKPKATPKPTAKPTATPKPKPTPKPTPKPKPTPQPTATPKPPDVQNFIKQGKAYMDEGSINQAISSFERAVQLDSKNAQAKELLKQAQDVRHRLIQIHLNKGIKHFTQDQLEEAMIEWNIVLELDPKHPQALDYKARTQQRIDEIKNLK